MLFSIIGNFLLFLNSKSLNDDIIKSEEVVLLANIG